MDKKKVLKVVGIAAVTTATLVGGAVLGVKLFEKRLIKLLAGE